VGDDVSTVRVCVLFDWHAPHGEYVNDEQVAGAGAATVNVKLTGW
jgi:hypothetical protein